MHKLSRARVMFPVDARVTWKLGSLRVYGRVVGHTDDGDQIKIARNGDVHWVDRRLVKPACDLLR